MWTIPMFGTDLYHIIHWFLIYSLMGWIVESIYMSLCNRKLTNRGFMSSPICPIYGVGALTLYFIFKTVGWKLHSSVFCRMYSGNTSGTGDRISDALYVRGCVVGLP